MEEHSKNYMPSNLTIKSYMSHIITGMDEPSQARNGGIQDAGMQNASRERNLESLQGTDEKMQL